MTKKYEHIGILPLEIPTGGTHRLRVETGETFEADLPPELEGFFLRVGLIREAFDSRVPATATLAPEEPVIHIPLEEE